MPVIKAQTPGIYLEFLGAVISLLLWLFAPARRATGVLLNVFFTALALLWLVVMVLSMVHGDAYTHGVWTYPVIVGMLWLKLPTRDEALDGLVLSGWILASILFFTRVLELLGLIPMATVSADMTAFERENYWLPLSGWLGPEGRWPGPMGHNANTGNAAAYLIVLGVALKRRYATVFVLVGVFALLLAMSRGSMLAVAVGVAIVLLLGDYPWTRRFSRRSLITAVLLTCLTVFALAFVVSPNLTGRTTGYWPMFLDLWRSSPWTGVGISGVAAGPEFIRDSNGHNLIIDVLAKYGLISILPLAAVLITPVILSIRAAARMDVVPMGLVATFMVIGVTEADFPWTGPSLPWLLLVLASVMAAGTRASAVGQVPANAVP
jgi:O-antigen ligase